MTRLLLTFVLGTVLSTAAHAECPKGSEQSTNAAGIPNCITVAPAAPAKSPSPQTCPPGSTSYSTFNGDTVCKRVDTGQEFLNLSVSCPLGTFPAVDVGGNRVCKR